VFLRQLTLKGFKSFADSTTLLMEPGVTVVVGPNGSGKSNVVDAIAWVLGAQAPSAVRSQKMEDVIFAGTARRPALGRAEVALTLDNSDGLLPIEFNEVTITRRLWRSGESEYALNGAPCRLLDVQELLSDSGVGRQQHVIVSQGQIDAVLNARPEDRRGIIEEAAGVLKYRRRKEKAERRLEATEGNLARVQDLVREVRRQMRPLEKQADAARRHGEVVSEFAVLQVHLAGRELDRLDGVLRELDGDRAALARREAELRAEAERLVTEVVAAEVALARLGGFALSDALVRVEQLRERARGQAAVVTERVRGVARDRERAMDVGVVANLEADVARMRVELGEVTLAAERIEPEAADLADGEADLARRRHELEAETATVGTANLASDALAEVRGELRSVRQAVERATAERQRAEQRRTALVTRDAALAAEVDRLRAQCAEAEAAEEPLVEATERTEASLAAADERREGADLAAQAARREHERWSARAEALALALDAARARAGAERLAGVPGVVGTLLDLVEVDPGWEAAFEAAAGEALAAVVVDGADAARRALQALGEAGASGAVLALGAAAPAVGPDPGRTASFGTPVRAHVRAADPAVGALLDRLVGTAVVVDGGWEAALDVSLREAEIVAVTRAGDCFGRSGWRVGATITGATGAALDDARSNLAQAGTALDAAEDELAAAAAAAQTARRELDELGRRLDDNDARFTAASEGLSRAQATRRELGTELAAIEPTLAELDERLARDRARLATLEARLPELEQQAVAERAVRERLRGARQELDRAMQEHLGRRRDLERRATTYAERQAFLERRIRDAEVRLAADAVARAEAAERRIALDRSMAQLERLQSVLARCRPVLEQEWGVLQEARQRHTEESQAVTTALESARRRRVDVERGLDEVREAARRADVDQVEARTRRETLEAALQREHGVDADLAQATPEPDLPPGMTAAQRAAELERELRILGPVNPLALEEHAALVERQRFLDEQLEDVRSSRRELNRVIHAVDNEIRSTFAAAFADVTTSFEALFASLFPGGVGKLVLTEPDDLLVTGIEIEAKPSGKNVKKLSLLSGGERSLTALAFLFAVFRSRPSPFYVMDEVEAALDDVNLHRFLNLLGEFRRDAQLIVVSHQKRTMEAADTLYGISMQPGGSSKALSERVATGAAGSETD